MHRSLSTIRSPAGEKLIDHLKKWLDPESLAGTECGWAADESADIAAAILDLFHRLPPAAVQFLETKGVHLELWSSERSSISHCCCGTRPAVQFLGTQGVCFEHWSSEPSGFSRRSL